jgi:hypothetical protein
MTGMINNIQAMGQRNQLYRQNQDEYQRQKAFREQRDQVANAYLNPAQVPNKNAAGPDPRMPVPTQAQDPEKAIAAMGDVSPRAKVAGKTLAAQSKQADVSMMSSEDAKQFQQKENDIVSWISQNGIDSIDKIPPELTAGVPGQKALVSALEREAAKAENKQKLFKRRMDFLTPKYQIFSLQSDAVNKALLEGREDDVVMGLRQMVKDLPIPYQLGEFNPEDRSFDVKYFDRRTGKLQSVEKKPLTEVIAEMNSTGKEKYFNQALLNMEAKRRENLEAEKNPLHGKTKGGTPVLITPQVPVQEPDGNLNIRVKDEKTGELLAEYKSWEALYDSGTSVENLEREYKKQQIATSKAAMGSHNRANQQDTVKALKAQLDFYSKRMKTTLEPFKEGSGNLGFSFDANGALVMDENGEGLYGKSQAFLAEHEGKQDSLSPEDRVKYAAAVSARQDMQAMIALGRQPQAMGGDENYGNRPGGVNPAVAKAMESVSAAIQKGDEQGAVDVLLSISESDRETFKQVMLQFPVEQRRVLWERVKQAAAGANELPRGDVVAPGERGDQATAPPKQDRLAPLKDVAGATTKALRPVGEGIDNWVRGLQR